MFNIGPGELIVILIVALVLLGPDKLPEMAKTVGKGMRELRKATEDLKDQVENELYEIDPSKPRSPILAASGTTAAQNVAATQLLPQASPSQAITAVQPAATQLMAQAAPTPVATEAATQPGLPQAAPAAVTTQVEAAPEPSEKKS